MDFEFCSAVIDKLAELEETGSCKAVVLSSSSKVFSAGIDLKRWLSETTDYVEPFMMKLEQLFRAVFCFSKPMVTDICGPAIAGGCMVAAAADFRVIHPDAKMGILESRLGVPLPMTAIEIMRHVANPQAFRTIVSVGATYQGKEAVDQGLADFSDSDSTAKAIALAEQLTQIPLNAFRLTKRQRTNPVIRIVEENQRELLNEYLQIWKSGETRDAIRKYVEERLKS